MRLIRSRGSQAGFTLVEVLMVIVIIGVLAALLLPVVAGAVRSARNAQVGAEEQVLSQALASFKNTFGDYPPSRLLVCEDGVYPTSSGSSLAVTNGADITLGQLATRSLSALRRFWPRINAVAGVRGTTTAPYPDSFGKWMDIDGDGNLNSSPYILDGRQCLVFFLGGIPQTVQSGSSTTTAMTGFSQDPLHPFVGPAVTSNRKPPYFEFNAGRLASPPQISSSFNSTFPAYLDSLGSTDPNSGQPAGFYAYFSAYGNNAYDPNDVNVTETDDNGVSPVMEFFSVAFPVFDSSNSPSIGPGSSTLSYAKSPSPNPYTSTFGQSTTGAVNWYNPNSYQIISPGADGVYGPGGQYLASGAAELLPIDPSATSPYNSTDQGIRLLERDNIANFHNGKLE